MFGIPSRLAPPLLGGGLRAAGGQRAAAGQQVPGSAATSQDCYELLLLGASGWWRAHIAQDREHAGAGGGRRPAACRRQDWAASPRLRRALPHGGWRRSACRGLRSATARFATAARGLGSGASGSRDWMAAATEDLRLVESAPGVESAGEIDGTMGEHGQPRGDDDEEILQFMDSVDGYLVLMDSLSSALRQGWLDMASARHSMGPSRVSSTLFDHKEQSAATKLQVVDHSGLEPSESKPHFALSKLSLQEECNSTYDVTEQASTEPKLRHRGSATTSDGNHERDATTSDSSTGADTSSHVRKARSKALSVFGALVSPKLRTAQISFETALELIVELANSRSNMLASFSQLKE